MMIIWTIAWTIFAANPVAAYTAERIVERTAAQEADIAARILSSKAGVTAALRGGALSL